VTPAALRELEKRLKSEPENIGLRVAVAGALHEVGRHAEAVELYRSVAVAYRDQGRNQQAIAVCRSILEIAPGDVPCQHLLAALQPPPPRRSSYDETPLPGALPYHVADPTTRSLPKLSELEIKPRASEPDGSFTLPALVTVPAAEGSSTHPAPKRAPPPPPRVPAPDVSVELETRKRPRIQASELEKITPPPPDFVDDDAPTRPPAEPNDTEEEVTVPRDEPGTR
jgi:hypothetical protein